MAVTAWRITLSMAMAALFLLMPSLTVASVLTGVDAQPDDNGGVNVDLLFTGGVPELRSYRLDSPPRVTLDLADTQNGLASRRLSINSRGVEEITTLEGNGRTRLVVNLSGPQSFTSRVLDDRLRITFASAANPAADTSLNSSPMPVASVSLTGLETDEGPQIENIDFRRGADGAGRLLVTFDREGVVANVREGAPTR